LAENPAGITLDSLSNLHRKYDKIHVPTNPPQTLHKASTKPPKIALTIAGFDPSNGAGITADLQVFAAHGLFGTAAITAQTVQNTRGVASVHPNDPGLLHQTLENLLSDLPPNGLKIGMLATSAIVETVSDFLEAVSQSPRIPIVLDPIILSSSGKPLIDPSGLKLIRERLLKSVTWIIPNWQELEQLTGLTIGNQQAAETVLHVLGQQHPHLHIVATGGDQTTPTDLLRLPNGTTHTFTSQRIESTSTHGTGCAFSSALLSNLILGKNPIEAVAEAKSFVEGAISHAPGLGQGRGPLNLLWPLHEPVKPHQP
jgi:hydroxymethylpyrimidine/phosphomethylpyrimidine kinase